MFGLAYHSGSQTKGLEPSEGHQISQRLQIEKYLEFI